MTDVVDQPRDGSAEQVMSQIAKQIRANGNGHGNDQPTRVFASPLARRLAREKGIDLTALVGVDVRVIGGDNNIPQL